MMAIYGELRAHIRNIDIRIVSYPGRRNDLTV